MNDLLSEERPDSNVEFGEFLAIIGDIQEAGWSVKRTRENEMISDQDLLHVFSKVDRNQDLRVNRMELRLACKYLCKQFNIDIKNQGELFREIIGSDRNNDGVLDFHEFKTAIKDAQRKLQENMQR